MTREGLSAAEYARFRDLVRERSGLDFGETRRRDLERAIAKSLAESDCSSPTVLYEALTDPEAGRTTLETFIAGLTIGETHFFRNRAQMQALERRIIPELVERKRDERRLRIWSAGCATGEEPYSIAILLHRLVRDLDDWNVTILATDINRPSLERATRGLYTPWSFREVPPEIERRYFTRRGNEIEVAPWIRERVTFGYLNLVGDVYPSLTTNTQSMDLVLCRNVLIYFNESTVRSVVGRLYDALIDGGWLVVGAAEPSQSVFGSFVAHNLPKTVLYQKTNSAVAPSAVELAAPLAAPPVRPTKVKASPVSRKGRARPARAATPSAAPRSRERETESFQTILALWRDGHADQAIRVATRVAERDPADGYSPYLAAKILASGLQFDEAADWAAVALEREPLLAPAHYVLGLVLQELGRADAAVESLRRCIYADPGFVLGHIALAGVFARSGRRSRAEKALENAERLLRSGERDDLVPEGDGVKAGRLLEIVAVQRELLE